MPLIRNRRGEILKPPTYINAPPTQSQIERRAGAVLKAAMTRFEKAHGADALIALLKTELAARGEDRSRLDAMAPKVGPGGQMSILDAGR